MAGRAKGAYIKKEASQAAVAMFAMGKTPDEIAAELSVSSSTVRRWMKDPEISGEVNELIREKSKYRVARALQVIEKQLDHPNPWVAQSAARIMLERFGPVVLTDSNSDDNVIRIEGMPKLGIPDGTIGRESVDDDAEDQVVVDDDEIVIDATIN